MRKFKRRYKSIRRNHVKKSKEEISFEIFREVRLQRINSSEIPKSLLEKGSKDTEVRNTVSNKLVFIASAINLHGYWTTTVIVPSNDEAHDYFDDLAYIHVSNSSESCRKAHLEISRIVTSFPEDQWINLLPRGEFAQEFFEYKDVFSKMRANPEKLMGMLLSNEGDILNIMNAALQKCGF